MAIDGNTSGDWSDGSCTHTKKDSSDTWWKVEMNDTYYIETVEIYNRYDCCSSRLSNFSIYIGNSSDYTENTAC